MPEPVSPPPSAKPEHTQTASGQSKFTETVSSSPSAAVPVGPAFGPPAAEGEVGTLGPYRVVKELGKGGMGAVYLATDTRLKRKIALKVMLPEFAANSAAKERFLREAQAAAQISHDNVVTVFEADERDGVPYIAMQFLNGLPLDQFLKQKPRLTVMQILRIAREAALGLSAAHKIGLVHRDIKPANLWLEAPHGRVKVLDFGLARPVHTEHELTQSGAVVGTPAYMSPEQARGEKVDHRTDLFSLGAVMYRLCTGELPFQGPTTMSVLLALGTEEPPEVRTRNPEIPEPVAALVHQLLAKKPENRPQTADEVVKRIRAIAEELTAPAQGSTPSTSLPHVVAAPVPVAPQPENDAFALQDATEAEPVSSAAEEAPDPVRKKSGKGVWIGAGFAALLALVAATVVIIIKNKDGSETEIKVPDGAGVTVKDKDGKVIAQVPPGEKPPATADADRKAAEWVLSIGGSVNVNGEDRDIVAAAELPKDPFSLTGVNLAENKAVTDAGLAHLKDCKNLKYLRLEGTGVTDAGLTHLRDCKNLTSLRLSRTGVTDAGLAHLKDCKNLTELRLASTGVTDAGLAHLKECKGLMQLGLNNTGVTDAGLSLFKDRKNLVQLHLSSTEVTDAGLARLKDCKNLKELRVTGTKVTAKGLADFHAAVPGCLINHNGGTIEAVDVDRKAAEWVLSIGGIVDVNGEKRELKAATELPKDPFSLTGVNLFENKAVTDTGLAHFKDCKNLTRLRLGGTGVTNAGLAHFKDCKNLTYLHLSGTGVTNAGLAHLKDCKNLKYLRLEHTGVTDAGLARFKECKDLKHLYVKGTKVTAKGLAEFHAAVPGCKIEHDGGTIEPKVIDDRKAAEWVLSIGGEVGVDGNHPGKIKGEAELPAEPFRLTYVNLERNPRVTDAGLANFKGCTSLIHLDLRSTKVTDAGLANFKDCKILTHIFLTDTRVGDAGLAYFKDCKDLVYLNLGRTEVTDAGLANFKDCKNLKEIFLNGSGVSDSGLAHFKDCKNLTFVHLTGTGFTDAGLTVLSELDKLLSANLKGTKVTAEGVAKLAKARPKCRIEYDGGIIEPQK